MLAPLATWLASLLAALLINIIWGLALAVWYLQKALAWLGDQVVTSNIWETIIDGLLTGLADSLPDTLSAIFYGTGGGLFYLALMLLGITFIIPYITNVRPALEIERVLGWTIFATFLFISSTAGYDLVGAIELYRMEMMTDISSNYGSNDISQLVAGPMSATPAEINVNEFVLPVAFEEIYFPDPAAFETVEVIFYDAPIIGANTATLTVETEASLENRRSQATLGLVLVILNIVPTVMVVILTAAFVGLTGTALILILFFLMALPLGMFESGMLVIQQIIRRQSRKPLFIHRRAARCRLCHLPRRPLDLQCGD